MATVVLRLTIATNDQAWADEFGLDARTAAADFIDHFTSREALSAVRVAVQNLTGAPITVMADVFTPPAVEPIPPTPLA